MRFFLTSIFLFSNLIFAQNSLDQQNAIKQRKKVAADFAKFVTLNPDTGIGPEIVTNFDFENASLQDLTVHMQELTGINLIWDRDLKGDISITSPGQITVGDAWKAYLTALNINGYTLIKTGKFYKIVKSSTGRTEPTQIYDEKYNPDVENFIMKIVPIKNIDSSEIRRNFRSFVSRFGRIIDISQTNTIIIHDTGANINKLMKLINILDVPGHEESLHIIKVENSSAQEMATILNKVVDDSRKKMRKKTHNGKVIKKIISEQRSNSIIALANQAGADELRELIKKLDVKLHAQESGKIHVYYLNYSNAESLAKTLNELVSGQKKSTQTRFQRRAQATPEDEKLFSAFVKITADNDNNALVVTASPTDWLTLKSVIDKLDIPRDQVLVEGLIMETNVQKQKEFGISIMGVYGTGAASKVGFSSAQTNVLDLIGNNITNLSGLFIGGGTGAMREVLIGERTVQVNSVNGLLKALVGSNNTNVLATPQVMTLDNVEAEFEVGESVPIKEVTQATNGPSIQSAKQQKVTLKLKIKPQINKINKFIKLEIDQNIEDFSQRNIGSAEGIGAATTIRRASTTVICKDGDTLAMSGLMRDQETESVNKVPILGDIPILGWLFTQQYSQVSKVNLLMFLTPKIVSPFDSSNSRNVRDILNRRSYHLKGIYADGDDPFATTAKSIFNKALKLIEDAENDNPHGDE